MYDKKKTIQQYMQGGYAKPMSYAKGGYIPGLSSDIYTAGLQRDKRIAMEEFEANAEKVAKEQYYRDLLGKVGSFAGTFLGAAAAAPTGGMSLLAGKALGSAIGKGAGELVGGSFVDTENLKKSSTGLYKDDFEYLEKQGREAQDLGGLAERSAISGATTYGLGKAGEVADFGKKAYAEKFGIDALENLGLAGETDPLLSSLTKDVSTAQAGAKSIIGDREKLLQDIIGGENIDFEDAYQDFMKFKPRNFDLELALQSSAGQEQVGQNIVGGGVLNLNQGGRVSGATPYSANITPEGLFQQILSVPASEVGEGKGLRYYSGEAMRPQMSLSKLVSGNRAINKMVTAPQDSIPIEMLKNYFLQEEPQPEKRGLRGLFGMSKGGKVEGYNQGGYIQGYEDGGMAKKSGMGYFDREFPKDSFKAMIQEAVYKGELDPREGLQYILNSQQKDFMKSKNDTSNVLYKKLKESGYNKGGKVEEYNQGGLIDMNSFSRRIL